MESNKQEGHKIKVGDATFNTLQNVNVTRTSGEVEKDWFVAGVTYDLNGKEVVNVQKEDEGGGVLVKRVPTEEFLSWQNTERPPSENAA